MTIVDEVIEVVEKNKDKERSSSYHRFLELYLSLLNRGLIKRPQYELPPVDTIGKRLIQLENMSKLER
jgi:hypothetical protein